MVYKLPVKVIGTMGNAGFHTVNISFDTALHAIEDAQMHRKVTLRRHYRRHPSMNEAEREVALKPVLTLPKLNFQREKD